MTGENPKSIELMEQMYQEIRKLDVPKSNISGVLDRVKYSIYSRIPNVSREEASRMLARYVFYDLDQKDNNVTERLNQELQQRAFDKRKHLEEIYRKNLSLIPGVSIIDHDTCTSHSYQYFVVRINVILFYKFFPVKILRQLRN